jgi:ribonuclease P protein component
MTVQDVTFGRSARLLESEDFASALRKKPVARGAFISLHMLRDRTDSARLGLIVPKRLLRRAVSRNSTKRVLRECFRLQRSALVPGKYVLRLTKAPPMCSLTQLKALVRSDANRLIEQCSELFRPSKP